MLRKLFTINKNKNYCNICDKYFESFSDFGEPPRKRVRCPDCGSLERHRYQWEYVINNTDIISSDKKIKLLHIAPEVTYYNLLNGQKNIDYTGIDIDPSYRGIDNLNIKEGDVRDMNFKDNSFDVIICNHVLEHVIEDVQSMKEIKRVLKKDGIALIDVPIDYNRTKTYEDATITDPNDRLREFGQHDHVRIYGTDFFDRAKLSGLKLRKINYTDKIGKNKVKAMSLMKIPLIIAHK